MSYHFPFFPHFLLAHLVPPPEGRQRKEEKKILILALKVLCRHLSVAYFVMLVDYIKSVGSPTLAI